MNWRNNKFDTNDFRKFQLLLEYYNLFGIVFSSNITYNSQK